MRPELLAEFMKDSRRSAVTLGDESTYAGPGRRFQRGGGATLATREKGEIVVEAMVAGMLQEIEPLRARRRP